MLLEALDSSTVVLLLRVFGFVVLVRLLTKPLIWRWLGNLGRARG